MGEDSCLEKVSRSVLRDIIRVQTEIVKLGMDLGAIMDVAAREAHRLTGSAGAIVELAEGDEMVYRAAAGIAKAQLGLRLKRESSLSGLCVAEGGILRCDDSEADARVDREACRKVGLRSMVVAPLFYGRTAVGVLKIVSQSAGFFDEGHVCVLGMMSDAIAAAMHHAAHYELSELYRRATHDPLTGLANRALFYDHLRQCFALVDRQPGSFGVLNIDMDGLKAINDRHGHRAGDAAICEAGSRIKQVSRQSDTVARLGGDEFAVLLARVKDRKSAMLVAGRIAKALAKPFLFEERPLRIGASIGLALFPEDGEDLEKLMEKADQSMYQAKRARKIQRGEF